MLRDIEIREGGGVFETRVRRRTEAAAAINETSTHFVRYAT